VKKYSSSTLWFAGGLAILFSASANAAGENYRQISASQIKAGEFKPGEKLSITGKYMELINQELRLHNFPVRFIITKPNQGQLLLGLKTGKDNLVLLGAFKGQVAARSPEEPVFQVEWIEVAPGDEVIFAGKLEALLASSGSAKELEDLAMTMAYNMKNFSDPALKPIARQAFSEAFHRYNSSLPAEDADSRLTLIQRYYSALKDKEFALQLLRDQVEQYPKHSPTVKFLSELRCYHIEGEWLSYDDFKKRLGFVLHEGRWVKKNRKEHLSLIEDLKNRNSTNLILRSRTDREYLILARSGLVEKGMNRLELVEALGLPDRVERIGSKDMEVDQWNYGDQRIYLLNGQMIANSNK